eukprot:Gregarina_sp_Poly_1__583@NODE_1139_length_4971_cov_35_431688_g785_i0_p2_GENE_NODE_1139_length_4971_cov_35_431688_g785_i0NODE_1139_length_4971_cov_35_431688_g785_i0_p2_ORF_typecomplete_len470_score64_07BRCT_2/PF16589_5/6_4e14BRCT/PF00533_26/1_9e06LIG3_BRCT/PF16759_5/0_00096LIG3_BRCT/PF16759_5/1_3e04RTT107_BRCT_5/PF16770_5/0_21Barttin/PF15462_6/0_43NESP55/PF06390_12/0_99_NODE_1139_length_4971_cov_35_431688_g785_i032614670
MTSSYSSNFGGGGFEGFQDYMYLKNERVKLQLVEKAADRKSNLFEGCRFQIDGRTRILDSELKLIIVEHGGEYLYWEPRRVTHFIADNLAMGNQRWRKLRFKRSTSVHYITSAWVLDSVKAGKRMKENEYAPQCLSELQDSERRSMRMFLEAKVESHTKTKHVEPGSDSERDLTDPIDEATSEAESETVSESGTAPEVTAASELDTETAPEVSSVIETEGAPEAASKIGSQSRKPETASQIDILKDVPAPCRRTRDPRTVPTTQRRSESLEMSVTIAKAPIWAGISELPKSDWATDLNSPSLASPNSAAATSIEKRRRRSIVDLMETPPSQRLSSNCNTPVKSRAVRMTNTDPNFVRNFFKMSRLHFIGRWRERIFQRFNFVKFDQVAYPPREELSRPMTKKIPRWKPIRFLHVDFDSFFVSVVIKKATQIPGIEKLPLRRSEWLTVRRLQSTHLQKLQAATTLPANWA